MYYLEGFAAKLEKITKKIPFFCLVDNKQNVAEDVLNNFSHKVFVLKKNTKKNSLTYLIGGIAVVLLHITVAILGGFFFCPSTHFILKRIA